MKARVTLLATVCAVVLAIGGLVGCKLAGEPATTEDLLVRFAANTNNANCFADGSADIALTLGGYRMPVPVTGHLDAADGNMHATVNVDMTSFADEVRVYEAYVEQQGNSFVGYVRNTSNDAAPWSEVQVDLSFTIDIPAIVDILSSARFMRASYDSDDQICYDLTLPATSVLDAVFGRGDVSTSFWEVDRGQLEEALGDSVLHVCFNKDCLVRSVSMNVNCKYEDKKVLPRPLAINLEFQATMDGYGTMSKDDLVIPDSVRESAVVTDDPFDADGLTDQLEAASEK